MMSESIQGQVDIGSADSAKNVMLTGGRGTTNPDGSNVSHSLIVNLLVDDGIAVEG